MSPESMSHSHDEDSGRPPIMTRLTATQADELERYYQLGNRDEWDQRTRDYGWSSEESQRVWDWFGNRAGERGDFGRDR